MHPSTKAAHETLARGIGGPPFLRGLSPAFLGSIRPGATAHRCGPKVFLLREGEEA